MVSPPQPFSPTNSVKMKQAGPNFPSIVFHFSYLIAHQAIPQLSVQLLLIGLHVDAAFQLGARSPNLKPDGAVLDTSVETIKALHTAVLQRVFQPGSKIWHKLVDGSVTVVSIIGAKGKGV